MLDKNNDEELRCESVNDEAEGNISVEELINQEFDVSVDVHYKQEDETKTEEQNEISGFIGHRKNSINSNSNSVGEFRNGIDHHLLSWCWGCKSISDSMEWGRGINL